MNISGRIASRWVRVAVVVALLTLSCSEDSTAPSDGGGGQSGLEVAAAVTGAVGPDGGSLETTGGDNATYRLVIPAGALTGSTQLKMTPYLSVSGADGLGHFGRGILLEPAGTEFDAPVTVHVDLPPGTTVPASAALYHRASADSLGAIVPTVVVGRRLSASLQNFSSVMPVAPTEAQLVNYINALSLTVQTYGVENTLQEISALVDVYVFVESMPGTFPAIDLPALQSEISGYLSSLSNIGIGYCNQSNCVDGTHLLERVESLALAMRLSGIHDTARDARMSCSGLTINARLTYPTQSCTILSGGEILPLNISVFNPALGNPVAGARVRLVLSGAGGQLAASTGITDALGHWSTTYTVPATLTGVAEIHVEVDGSCDPNYEVVEYVTGLPSSLASGPVFGLGKLPSDPWDNWLGYFRASSNVVGGENDEGTSAHRDFEGTCGDSAFVAIPNLALAASAAFEFGSCSAQSSLLSNYDDASGIYQLSFTAAGSGSATGSYAEWGGNGEVVGSILYQKPSGHPFPAGAMLKVTVDWAGNVMQARVKDYLYYNGPVWNTWVSDTRSFDIPVTEGEVLQVVRVAAYIGASSSGSPHLWGMSGSVRFTIECVNCGE